MTKNQPLCFVAVVEQHSKFDYSESPRIWFTTTHLPSAPNNRSQRSYLERVQDDATGGLKPYLPTDDCRFLVWLVDEAGVPSFFVTGLLNVRNGRLTHEAAAEFEVSLHPQITCEQPLNSVVVRYEGILDLTASPKHRTPVVAK